MNVDALRENDPNPLLPPPVGGGVSACKAGRDGGGLCQAWEQN
jgi:hypothetical protein